MAQTLEQQIRRVIKQHYGENLSLFREDVDYRNGTKAFVSDVAKAIKGKLGYLDDLPNEVAKYRKPGTLDRSAGIALRSLRIKKGISQEQLAKTMGFHLGYLDGLENGTIVVSIDVYIDTRDALKPTKKEKAEFTKSIDWDYGREAMIREVIDLYYGLNLWTFKCDVSYEESIEPFIKSLAELAQI